jgi:hypothetical protein
VAPLHVPVLLDPGCAGSSLLDTSLALIIVSISTPLLTPPLRFLRKRLSIQKEEGGRLNIHFAKWIFNADAG